jgi:hypothetical protein
MELARSVEAERRNKGLQLGAKGLRGLLAHDRRYPFFSSCLIRAFDRQA